MFRKTVTCGPLSVYIAATIRIHYSYTRTWYTPLCKHIKKKQQNISMHFKACLPIHGNFL
jgi:hypothetical protein